MLSATLALAALLAPAGAETGPLAFTCAWISLYEKRDGRWRHVGNVSNFLPE